MSAKVGVLALQGDFAPHAELLRSIGAEPRLVRNPSDLEGLAHLVLPGGESTTLHHLLVLFALWDSIGERCRRGELALLGTCAGAILLAEDAGGRPPTLGLLDVDVERNAYGRQIDSFSRTARCDELGGDLRCVFIRAPRIRRVGPGVLVLAKDGADPILVEGPGILAATFHPELGEDSRVHERFLALAPRSPKPMGAPGGARQRDRSPRVI